MGSGARMLAAVAAGGLTGVAVWSVRRHQRELAAAHARLDAFPRETVATPAGTVEFAVQGSGEPVLVSHGIFHGCDGALLSVRDVIAGRQVIAPSRFGYLGSSLPAGATPADQADAFVALLDHLGVERVDAVGISAGATAALQLALRHPERLDHLVILAGNLPGGTTAVQQPGWARLFYTDQAMWLLKTLAPPMLERLSGVPRGFECSPEDRAFVTDLIESLFPVAPRADGIAFDAFVSNPAVNGCVLEDIAVPTLLIHAQDDPLASYDAAERAAARIPGAVLLRLGSGGHLTLGQTDRVRVAIDSFLTTPAPATAPVEETAR